MTDADAMATLHEAARGLGLPLGRRALLLVQSQARGESGYGSATFKGCVTRQPKNNWGSIHGEPGVACTDTNERGEPYVVTFRDFESPLAGASALLGLLWRRPSVRRVLLDDSLDVDAFAGALRRREPWGYYEAPEAVYAAMLRRNLRAIRGA